jgi:uncharacterized membrane protein HdeD (DUF308 family)
MANGLLPKGTMRPVKQVVGAILLIAGLGLVIWPDKTAALLCDQKLVFGILVAIGGYFHAFSGRQL